MDAPIITFYSYKGGTGRSMGLANTAWILASNGLRVLVIDWDLEAPGLHRYFHPFIPDRDLQASPGVIDLVWEFVTAAMDPEGPDEPGWHEKFARISPYAMSIEHGFPGAGTIDLVPAGRQDSAYSSLVSSFDWANFYDRLGGGGFLEALKRNMRERYDYVLVDSRTGLSDTAGICTIQLPDILVNCFSFSSQSIDGAAAVAASVHRQRRTEQLRLFPVPMRVEDGEQDKLDASRDYARARFGRFLSHVPDPDRYWGDVEVPYKSYYAYEEILATVGDRPRQENTILAAAERLVGYLTDGRVTELAVPPSEPERRALLARFHRAASSPAVPTGSARLSGRSPKVFISYAYASAKHFEDVRELWYLLRDRGVDARLDPAPGQRQPDWSRWLVDELRGADVVVVVASSAYREQADGNLAGTDQNAVLPPPLVRNLYASSPTPPPLVAVVLPGGSPADLPDFLDAFGAEKVSVEELSQQGLEPFLRVLAAQATPVPPSAPGRPELRPDEPVATPLQDAAEELGRVVGRQWRAEFAASGLVPFPLRLRWASTNRLVAPKASTALGGSGTTRRQRPRLSGDAASLADAFLALPHRQLVVLGKPGAGKTTLMINFVLDMLRRRQPAEPVPVLLSLASWQPDVESLDAWLARRLTEEYPFLADTQRFGPAAAEELLSSGYVLPVLDGLDELPEALRAVALRTGLNDSPASQRPMIVTSRTMEYTTTVRTTGRPLFTAAVIELKRVTVEDAISFLSASTLAGDHRWEPVFKLLRANPHNALAVALSTPLMVALARDAYAPPTTDPTTLLNRERLPDARSIESHLLDEMIPVAYRWGPVEGNRDGRRRYNTSAAERWLTFLAAHLHDTGTADLAWWELHRAAPAAATRYVFGLLGGLVGVLTLGVVTALGAVSVPRHGGTGSPVWFVEVFTWYVATFVAAAGSAAIARPPTRPWPLLRAGPRSRSLPSTRPVRPQSPTSSLRQARRSVLASIAIWASVGIASVAGYLEWHPNVFVARTVAACIVGGVVIHCSNATWIWYTVSRLLLALRGSLPLRLMTFLADAHRRGILRQHAAVYQFRHARLRDHLAHRSTRHDDKRIGQPATRGPGHVHPSSAHRP